MCPSQPSISATPSSGLGNDCPIIIARISQNARGIFKFFTAFSASSLFLRPAAPAPGKKAAAAQEKPRIIRINERFWAFTCRRRGSNPVQNFFKRKPACAFNVFPSNSEICFSGNETANTVREIEVCYKMCYLSRFSGSRIRLRTLSRSAAVCTSSP